MDDTLGAVGAGILVGVGGVQRGHLIHVLGEGGEGDSGGAPLDHERVDVGTERLAVPLNLGLLCLQGDPGLLVLLPDLDLGQGLGRQGAKGRRGRSRQVAKGRSSPGAGEGRDHRRLSALTVGGGRWELVFGRAGRGEGAGGRGQVTNARTQCM